MLALLCHFLQNKRELVKKTKEKKRKEKVTKLVECVLEKNDFAKVVNKSGSKDKIKKRLLLANLHEIYVQFKNETNEKIGISTWSAL